MVDAALSVLLIAMCVTAAGYGGRLLLHLLRNNDS